MHANQVPAPVLGLSSCLSPEPRASLWGFPGVRDRATCGCQRDRHSPKRSVFKEAPVMPFALEPCPGDGHLGGSRTRARSAPWCPRLVVFLHL